MVWAYFHLLCGEILIRVIGQQTWARIRERVQRRAQLMGHIGQKVGFVSGWPSTSMGFELDPPSLAFSKSSRWQLPAPGSASSNWELVLLQLDLLLLQARLGTLSSGAALALSNSVIGYPPLLAP